MKELKIPASPGSGNHPSSESLFEVVTGQGEAARRLEIEGHVAVCSECSAELAHLESFQAPQTMSRAAREAAWRRFATLEPQTARRAPPNPPRSPRPRFPVWAFAVAAAVLLAGIALPLLQKTPPARPEVERGTANVATLVSPRGLLPGAPEEFTFRNPSSQLVRVAVFDGERAFSWTSEPTTSERVAFPADQRARLVASRDYFWTLVGTGSPAPVGSFRIATR